MVTNSVHKQPLCQLRRKRFSKMRKVLELKGLRKSEKNNGRYHLQVNESRTPN